MKITDTNRERQILSRPRVAARAAAMPWRWSLLIASFGSTRQPFYLSSGRTLLISLLTTLTRETGRRLPILLICAGLLISQAPAADRRFCKAILTKETITLTGGVIIDSFDSEETADGLFDPAKRTDRGDIASNSGSQSAIDTVVSTTGSAQIYGHVATGTNGAVSIKGNVSIGSLDWVNGGNRGVQPDWFASGFYQGISDAALPNVTFATLTESPAEVNGTNYSYVLTTGHYQGPANFQLSNSTSICINGNVVLYFPDGIQISGNAGIYIAPGAQLTLYLGGVAALSGKGTINGTGLATNCTVIGLPSCTALQVTGSSDFVGTICAPQAEVQMSGGGSLNANFTGAVIARSVKVSGHYSVHFDESLCPKCDAPAVLIPPVDQIVCAGDNVGFSVSASGRRLKYQWYKGTEALDGQTGPNLALNAVTIEDAGTYTVAVTDACGNVVSNSISLRVGVEPVLGDSVPIDKAVMLPEGNFLLEFFAARGRTYYVQYTSNIAAPDWKTAEPAITGSCNLIQWIDNGPPTTESAPSTVNVRFYRVIVLQ